MKKRIRGSVVVEITYIFPCIFLILVALILYTVLMFNKAIESNHLGRRVVEHRYDERGISVAVMGSEINGDIDGLSDEYIRVVKRYPLHSACDMSCGKGYLIGGKTSRLFGTGGMYINSNYSIRLDLNKPMELREASRVIMSK